VLNHLELSVEEIVRQLEAGSRTSKPVEWSALEKRNGWVPWFPVIDYGRCVNCRQCLSFCLFGVYAASPEGRVEVRNPSNCKTNCPACARICPEIAIMFPKHAEGPINGAPIVHEEIERAKVKVNIEQMLGSDPYGALADRRKRARLMLLKKQSATVLATPPSTSPGLVTFQFKNPE
jgi:Pyruvate/2-oxoacid:ferredoxin oxidoreductase delta subunit